VHYLCGTVYLPIIDRAITVGTAIRCKYRNCGKISTLILNTVMLCAWLVEKFIQIHFVSDILIRSSLSLSTVVCSVISIIIIIIIIRNLYSAIMPLGGYRGIGVFINRCPVKDRSYNCAEISLSVRSSFASSVNLRSFFVTL